ncbi:tyrosine-type recombinase/integrase [Leucobacter rhizosphaerae]|uniref:Tyrosine-type recombinase/integrase n=1 Tax=Leucobacter rhizosphaerae TaxID=2932245 RepID=A0ABY4FVN9_9MICO|nr:tyrosine-type recombinase/integrase [Leucobacter rhizosphaerae]UOQ60343.1 tyrosine-type recombinase/integrase [Leucobacter rhizosphaerae]
MARAPLVLETHGKITRKKVNGTPTAFTRYRDADGITRKVQRIGRTLSEAEQNLQHALKTRHIEDEHAALSPDSTVDQLIAEWLDEARSAGRYAAATLRTYSQRAASTITPGIGSVRIREATVSKMDRFVKLTTKNHGPGTARTVRTILVNAFELALRHGLVDFNRAKNTAPVPATKSTPAAPSLAMIRDLLPFLKAHDAALIERGRPAYLHDLIGLYLATGARTAELLALEWPSVEIGTDVTKVSIEATLIVNEAGKLERQKFTKSDAGMRRLTLPPAAALTLQERRAASYCPIVFPSSTGTHRWPHNLRREWREAVKGTQFEGLTPKSFRKAVATLLRDDMGIEAARDQLGHSDERVTKAHYAQRLADAPDATLALEKFFQSAE